MAEKSIRRKLTYAERGDYIQGVKEYFHETFEGIDKIDIERVLYLSIKHYVPEFLRRTRITIEDAPTEEVEADPTDIDLAAEVRRSLLGGVRKHSPQMTKTALD